MALLRRKGLGLKVEVERATHAGSPLQAENDVGGSPSQNQDQENVPAQKAATPVVRHADYSRALVPPSVLRVVHQPRWFRKESAGAGTESGSSNLWKAERARGARDGA